MASVNRDSYATFEENVTSSVQHDATFMNYSGEYQTLEEINDAVAKTHTGGSIFVGILMLIGFVGNLHVILIYSFRKKQSNYRVFILCLAALDMVACSVGMPFTLVDLRYPLMFYDAAACKILCFLNYFMCASSALVLLVIATERYRKICIPHGKQMTETVAKVSCGVAMTIGLVVSSPVPVLYGYSTHNTNVNNITGVRCWTDDKFKDTPYQFYFNLLLMFLVLGAFTVLCVLYAITGVKILRHKTVRSSLHYSKSPITATTSSSKESSGGVENPTDSTGGSQEGSERDAILCVNSNREMKVGFGDFPLKSTENRLKMGSEKKDNLIKTTGQNEKTNLPKNEQKTRRITFIMFMITLVFFCSFIPHLILQIVDFITKDFLASLSPAGLYLYNTFIWSFFINNMANPVIYGFCDKTFRRELLSFYGRFRCSHVRN